MQKMHTHTCMYVRTQRNTKAHTNTAKYMQMAKMENSCLARFCGATYR